MPDVFSRRGLLTGAAGEISVGIRELLNMDIGGISLGNLLAALVIFFVCLVLIRLCVRLLRRALDKTTLDAQLKRVLVSVVRAVLWVTAVLVILGQLNVSTTSLVALVSVAGLALSLSLQNTLSNVFAGVTLLMTRPFAVGDFVETGTTGGTVTRMGLFYVTMLTADNKEIHVPNSDISASRLTNYTAEPSRRVDLSFGLEYACDADAVRTALLVAAAEDERILPDPAPSVVVSAYQASSVQYTLRVWAATGDYWNVYYALNESSRRHLEAAGLSLAFDRMDVRIVKE